MFKRFAALGLFALLASPAMANDENAIRYDRMYLACPSIDCTMLVRSLEAELEIYHEKYQDERTTAYNRLQFAGEFAKRIRKEFPAVWLAQDCSLGSCWSVEDMKLVK